MAALEVVLELPVVGNEPVFEVPAVDELELIASDPLCPILSLAQAVSWATVSALRNAARINARCSEQLNNQGKLGIKRWWMQLCEGASRSKRHLGASPHSARVPLRTQSRTELGNQGRGSPSTHVDPSSGFTRPAIVRLPFTCACQCSARSGDRDVRRLHLDTALPGHEGGLPGHEGGAGPASSGSEPMSPFRLWRSEVRGADTCFGWRPGPRRACHAARGSGRRR